MLDSSVRLTGKNFDARFCRNEGVCCNTISQLLRLANDSIQREFLIILLAYLIQSIFLARHSLCQRAMMIMITLIQLPKLTWRSIPHFNFSEVGVYLMMQSTKISGKCLNAIFNKLWKVEIDVTMSSVQQTYIDCEYVSMKIMVDHLDLLKVLPTAKIKIRSRFR